MSIKTVHIKYGINQGINVPKKVFFNEKFRKTHNKFFGYFDTDSMEEKIKKAGYIVHYALDEGITSQGVDAILYFIKRLMHTESLTNEKVELANVFYSTLIKKIKPQDIIDGKITPGRYVSLIQNSIKNYYNYPVGKEVDYRHVAGRMLNLKVMSESIPNSELKCDPKFEPLKWTLEWQTDLVGALERILVFYKSIPESFKHASEYKSGSLEKFASTYEEHESNFYENIFPLFALTLQKIQSLMREPVKNKDEIEDIIQIAYHYYDKVPYTSSIIKRLSKLYLVVRKLEMTFKNAINNKRNKCKNF